MAMLAQTLAQPRLSSAARRAVARPARRAFVCNASQDLKRWDMQKMALPLATAVATCLISGAIVPEEALAAKSGGRAGGSGFSSRRAAPAAQSRTSSTTVVNNYVAAPMVAPPVYGGWGFGGFSVMPTFFMPVPFAGLGTILSLFLVVALVGAVFNVVSSMGSGSKKNNDWDN